MKDKKRLDPGSTVVVIVGLALGVLLITEFAATERNRFGEQAGEQRSIVTLSALAQLVTATHALGGDLQKAVSSFVAGHDDVVLATVYGFRNRELLASTDPQYASGAWPRRLERRDPNWKSWAELGSRLRSAVELNERQRQSLREEIAVERLESGHLALAAPIAYGGNIHHIVVMLEARGAAIRQDGFPILAGILILTVPVFFLFISGRPRLGNGRVIAVVGVVGVTLSVFFFVTDRELASANRTTEEKVAARLLADYQRLQDLGLDPQALDPKTWDVDRFRRPRGMISAEPQQRFRQRGVGVVILALALSTLMGWFRTFSPRSINDTTDAKSTRRN